MVIYETLSNGPRGDIVSSSGETSFACYFYRRCRAGKNVASKLAEFLEYLIEIGGAIRSSASAAHLVLPITSRAPYFGHCVEKSMQAGIGKDVSPRA